MLGLCAAQHGIEGVLAALVHQGRLSKVEFAVHGARQGHGVAANGGPRNKRARAQGEDGQVAIGDIVQGTEPHELLVVHGDEYPGDPRPSKLTGAEGEVRRVRCEVCM